MIDPRVGGVDTLTLLGWLSSCRMAYTWDMLKGLGGGQPFQMSARERHARKPARDERTRTVLACTVAVFIAVAIFALTSQTPEVTSAESGFVNDLMVALLGWIPGLYDPATGLWLGIGIRHWAHAVEFGALGLSVALAAKSTMGPRVVAPCLTALAICAGFPLFD